MDAPAAAPPHAPDAGTAPASPLPGKRSAGDGSGRRVLAGGLLLALALLAGFIAFAWHERQQQLDEQQDRAVLLARVLEDHAARSFEGVGLALGSLAELLASAGPELPPGLPHALAGTAAGTRLLRGVALVDPQGRVLASSVAEETGLRLDPTRLAPPAGAAEHIGGWVRGRGLAALAGGAADPAPPGVGFVPVLRRARAAGRELWLVGLVNPDAIANHHTQLLADEQMAGVLADDRGGVLASTPDAGVAPGDSLAALPPFASYLPQREHAGWIGAGTRPGEQVAAFRASRGRPLVVLVERPREAALAGWRDDMAMLGSLAALGALAIVGAAVIAARAARARESARGLVAARERELSVIVRSVQALIFRADAQGRLTFVNARWAAATGAREDEAPGRRLADWAEPASVPAARALFDPEGGLQLRSATLVLGPEGRRRSVEVTVLPLASRERIVGFAGSAVDVTERLQAERRVQAQLAFTELLLDVMPLPVSVLDADNRYLSVNQAWQEFTGRSRQQVLGRRAREFLGAEEAARHDARDRELMAHGGRDRYEAVVPHRDGTHRDVAITKAAVPGPDGRCTGVLVAFMDVSEFRAAERAVREARDIAEEASRAKSEFVANISHELRTPLQSIIGFSELGSRRAGENPRAKSMFDDIHAAGQRMLALVNDLLDVARIESSVGTFHLEKIDLRTLVREALRELEPLIAQRRLHVELDLCDAPLVAKVDPLRYLQVLRNVLANAIRFSPEGALLGVSGDIDAAHQVHVAVRDQGPGIPPQELESIFEAFVQSSKTKDGSGGTGLGLTICRTIIEAHEGRIRAENAEGGGSIFHICVPARSAETSAVL